MIYNEVRKFFGKEYVGVILEVGAGLPQMGSPVFPCCGLSKDFDWAWFPRSHEYKTIMVEALILNTILKKHHPDLEKIDVIIVDVEWYELDAISGIDLERYSPEVVIMENIRSEENQREYMNKSGYSLFKRIDIDDFYIKTAV